MKNYFFALIVVFFFPVSAFASGMTFSPSSPQDVSVQTAVTCAGGVSIEMYEFDPVGAPVTQSTCSPGVLGFSTGVPGTYTFAECDLTVPGNNCAAPAPDLATVQADPGFVDTDTFEWTKTPLPFDEIFGVGALSEASSTTVSIVDNPTQDLMDGILLMYLAAASIVWFFRKRK